MGIKKRILIYAKNICTGQSPSRTINFNVILIETNAES